MYSKVLVSRNLRGVFYSTFNIRAGSDLSISFKIICSALDSKKLYVTLQETELFNIVLLRLITSEGMALDLENFLAEIIEGKIFY